MGLPRPAGAAAQPAARGVPRPAIHLPHRPAVSPQGIPVDYSGNWSGYIALPEAGGATSFSSVTASFTVPSVNCSVTRYAFSYHWAGLDGWTDSTVEQAGVASRCVNGSPQYFAWWEMYPFSLVQEFAVNPGDAVTADVQYAAFGLYLLSVVDHTTGKSFLVNQIGAGTRNSSAEVITEGYTASPYNGTADFGVVHYDTAEVTDSPSASGGFTSGGLTSASWNTVESIALGATTGQPDTMPGPLATSTSPAASAFPVTWLREN